MHKMKNKKLNIIGLIDSPTWEQVPCCCGSEIIDKYPINKNCNHCRCKKAQDSMPRDCFEKKCHTLDAKGKIIKTETKTVTEIKIVRSRDGFDSILGWEFNDP